MSEPRIAVAGVSVRFGELRALEDVSWTVDGPGVVGLIGLNGAGKSTLIRVVLGLQPVVAGGVEVPVGLDAIGFCPDTPGFEPWLTAHEVLEQSVAIGAPRTGAAPIPASEALALVGLERQARRPVGGFSRGMSQRLGIAAALVRDPQVLILDEPTSALDPEGRELVLALIRDLGRRMTVVFSSHLLADVEAHAQQLLVLHHGRAVFAGATGDFLVEHAGEPVLRMELGSRTVAVGPAQWAGALTDAAAHVTELTEIRLSKPSLADAFFAAIGESR